MLLFVLCALGYFFFTKSANSTIKGHISPAKVHRSPEYRSRPSAGDPTRLIGSPTTTIKAQHFLSKPLRDVALRDVPGVGIVVASKLEVNFRHPAPYPHLSIGSTCCPQLIRTRPNAVCRNRDRRAALGRVSGEANSSHVAMLSVTWRLNKNIITNSACRDDGKFENWLVNACGMRAMDARKIVDPIAEKAAKLVRQ